MLCLSTLHTLQSKLTKTTFMARFSTMYWQHYINNRWPTFEAFLILPLSVTEWNTG